MFNFRGPKRSAEGEMSDSCFRCSNGFGWRGWIRWNEPEKTTHESEFAGNPIRLQFRVSLNSDSCVVFTGGQLRKLFFCRPYASGFPKHTASVGCVEDWLGGLNLV